MCRKYVGFRRFIINQENFFYITGYFSRAPLMHWSVVDPTKIEKLKFKSCFSAGTDPGRQKNYGPGGSGFTTIAKSITHERQKIT